MPMKRSTIEIIAGVFVFAGMAALLLLAINLGGLELKRDGTYTLRARFTNASGVNVGSPVKIAGVTIGQVTAVRLDRKQMVAMVSLQVPADVSLDDDTIAAIRTNGLIGDRFIALFPGGSGMTLEPDDLIIDTESAIDIESLISRFAFGDAQKDQSQ